MCLIVFVQSVPSPLEIKAENELYELIIQNCQSLQDPRNPARRVELVGPAARLEIELKTRITKNKAKAARAKNPTKLVFAEA